METIKVICMDCGIKIREIPVLPTYKPKITYADGTELDLSKHDSHGWCDKCAKKRLAKASASNKPAV